MNDLIILIVVIAIILMAGVAILSAQKDTSSKVWKDDVRNKLARLSASADTVDKLKLYHCLVEADKLLDHTMKLMEVSGSSMGERLKAAQRHFDAHTYNSVWEAHKLRNKLVHEVDFQVSSKELKAHFIVLSSAISRLSK